MTLPKDKHLAKQFHCEICGQETSKENMRLIGQISCIINLHSHQISRVNEIAQMIEFVDGSWKDYSFFVSDLNSHKGKFALAVKKVTQHLICSEKCINTFLAGNSRNLTSEILQNTVIEIPDGKAFIPILVDKSHGQNQKCEFCSGTFLSMNGSKYKAGKISRYSMTEGKLGEKPRELENYGICLSDITQDRPSGNNYLYKVEGGLADKILCTNECAYNYSVSNQSLVLCLDLINRGQIRAISPDTELINGNLDIPYKYKSSFTGMK